MDENEKTTEEIAFIAKDIINILAKKNCTVADADNALRIARKSIDNTTTVRKLEY